MESDKRDLLRVVGWYCVVLGVAQGIYQLNWALMLTTLPAIVDSLAVSYLICSAICFVAAGLGIYLLRSESPNLSLLGWLLLVCFGIALIGEGLYMSARYASGLSLHAWVHLARNITLDLWLPFAAALLAVSSAQAYPRRLMPAMLWWVIIESLFYLGVESSPITGCLMVLVWLATVGGLVSALYQDNPSAWMLLLASALWVVLLVYTVLVMMWSALSGTIAHPVGASSQFAGALMWSIGTLNDWVYNSAPFWLFMVLHRRLFWG